MPMNNAVTQIMDNNKKTQHQEEVEVQETPDAKIIDKIVSEKKIQGEWPLTRLFALFDSLTQHDMQIEKKRAPLEKRYRLLFGAAVAAYLLAGYIGWKITENPMSWAWAAIPAGLLFLGSILQILLGLKYQKYDVANDFRDYVRPVLEALQEDIKPNSRVYIDLYLSPVFQKEFHLGKGKKYKARSYRCRDHFFERDLVTMKFRLSDGNRVMLRVHEVLIKTYKSGWKKNPRTKDIKHKTKVQYRRRISCAIRLAVTPEKFICKELPTGEDRRMYAKQRNGGFILGLKYTEKFKKCSRPKLREETLQDELMNNQASFEISQQTLDKLKTHGLSGDVLEKLGEMEGHWYLTKENFLTILGMVIGDEDTEKYRELILKQSESRFHPDPGRIVQGLVTLYTFLQAKKTV